MSLRRNILLFHSGALGDFLLTWPLALALGRVLAQSRVFYVTGKQKGLLAEKVLRVESVDAEAGWHQLFSETPNLPAPAAKLLAGAQALFNLVAEPGSLWTTNVAKLAPEAQLVTLSTVAPRGYEKHQTEYLLEQLQPFPIFGQGMQQMLRSIEQRGVGHSPAGNTPIIHPGSGGREKCWPAERFVELARRLKDKGQTPRIAIGEVEHEQWTPAQIKALADGGDLHRPADLSELLHCFTRASVFIGNDSGPGHLAGLLGLPTVSLFGPTDPARWKPLGPNVQVIRKEPIDAIEVDEVLKAVGDLSKE